MTMREYIVDITILTLALIGAANVTWHGLVFLAWVMRGFA